MWSSRRLINTLNSAVYGGLHKSPTQVYNAVRNIATSPLQHKLSAPTVRQVILPDLLSANVAEGTVNLKTVEITFGDESRSLYPHVWLRENCQCSQCFNKDAIARLFLVDELDLNIQPKDIQLEDGGLRVTWTDGHESPFTGQWLHERAFNEKARSKQRANFSLPHTYWGADFQIPELDYERAMTDDKALLEWLVILEKYGVILIKDSPATVGPLKDFINRLGFIKPTHYGTDYEIITHLVPNNLAYTGAKLGLHTDLPYVDHPPGTTWLHCINQHEGKGGDNDISDGFHAAHILKDRDRFLYDILTQTPIYFQDKGFHTYDFNKITKSQTIMLDGEGNLSRINISSQSRDSLMDLDPERVMHFYKALKTFNNILYEISIRVKTQPGDMLVLDNMRVLHGRTAFDPDTSRGDRHIHNAYIDWSELRSKRRVLQEKFGMKIY